MNRINFRHNSKSGQQRQKFYALMLVLILIVLALLNYFYSGNSEEKNSLQPIRAYTSNTDGSSAAGLPVEVYSGMITKISDASIMLSDGAKSGEFRISEQYPAKFVNSNGEPVKPKVGDNAVQLYLVEVPSKGKYVSRVVIG